jgi:ribosomal protein S18 acetylase RimI-like enzyme
MTEGPLARLAGVDDVDEIVRLREVMFVSLGNDAGDPGWRDTTTQVLRRELAGGDMLGAVVDRPDGPGLCGCALLEIAERISSPRYPLGRQGYLASVCVDPAYRRRGAATAVTALLLDEARARGLERVMLHASPSGEPVYRSLGFADRPGGKELVLVLVEPR